MSPERDICPEGYHCVDGSCLRDVPGHWVGLPSGAFTMGSPDDENGRDPAGETEHEVTLTRRFEISETEVTQEACG